MTPRNDLVVNFVRPPEQVAQVIGQTFESEWAFIQWAEDEGYRPGRPPRDPEPLESVLEELTRH